ncbi:hypothetical protein Gohar_017320 [Gossypium harknessii]|uniref:Uncharacterized protein n=1 Tax=Gossypium harknessii TaxID=34285 RepID=A0A7J9G5H5_9ROSI|nr:hypothetical protein [Gossypium harknessii]
MIFLPPEGKVLPFWAGCRRGRIRTPDTVDASAEYITTVPLDTYRNDKRLVSLWPSFEFSKFLSFDPRKDREPLAILAMLLEALGKSK